MQKNFTASTSNLPAVIFFIESYLKEKNIDKKQRFFLQVVAEELFVNICKHAYENKNENMSITIEKENDLIKLIFVDKGIAFNILEKSGGVGIVLVKKIMDTIEYERNDSLNILTLKKRLY